MTGDPQMRFTQNGKAVLNIGIDTNVNGFAEFHDVVAWEKAAEVIGSLRVALKARAAARPLRAAAYFTI
jgi:single-stranded DNA-binding protein